MIFFSLWLVGTEVSSGILSLVLSLAQVVSSHVYADEYSTEYTGRTITYLWSVIFAHLSSLQYSAL